MQISADGNLGNRSTFGSLPFGDGLIGAGPDATEQNFTGKERDSESGNDYFGARYYASSMGRFMTPDWAEKPEAVPYSSLDNPQSLNLYSYVKNNPLSKSDPSGHCCWDEFTGAVAGILNTVPDTINFVNGATNAAISPFTSYRFQEVQRIEADNPAMQTGMNAGTALMMAAPIGDMAESAQILRNSMKGATGEAAGISMSEAVGKAASHVDGGVMEETGKGTNYQFRNTTTDASGNTVSKIGRFDVNPSDPHVAAEGPHLNLETHTNGKPVSNQHISIDPSTVRPGDNP